jgi:hypothetical protein
MLFRDKLAFNASVDLPYDEPAEKKVEPTLIIGREVYPGKRTTKRPRIETDVENTVPSPLSGTDNAKIRLVRYTDRSFVVYGDSKFYASKFSDLRGIFSFHWKEGAGWVFSKKKEVQVRTILKDVLPPDEPCLFEENVMPSLSNEAELFKKNKAVKPYKMDKGNRLSVATDYSPTGSEGGELTTKGCVSHPGYDSVEKYLTEFKNMRTIKLKGFQGPQKCIMLLTIFRGIKEGWIQDNKIPMTAKLITVFTNLWDKYVPTRWPFVCNARQPYMHLSSESFYHLNLKKKILNLNIPWSVPDVLDYCHYAYLDEALFRYASNPSTRELMIRCLVETYIDKQISKYI